MPIFTVQIRPCPKCGVNEWQVVLPAPPRPKRESALLAGGLVLAMLGVATAVAIATKEPPTINLIPPFGGSSDDDRPQATCLNCGTRIAAQKP